MTHRFFAGVVLLVVALTCAAAAQRGRTPAPALPPLSMTCPHHPDVIESSPGSCPYCRMALVPVRLAPAWTCPVHPVTIADRDGTCPICRRALVPVTVAVTYRCGSGGDETLEPGTCPDGRPRTLTRTLRPHGDHNPRHGGQFFMAGDNWHHVEGVHPAARAFRLFVYDDYGRPLSPERMRGIAARVVTSERFDPASRRYLELRAFPLRPSRNADWLEARVDSAALPLELTAKVRFTRDGEEYRFDFTFRERTPAAPPQNAASPPRAPRPAASRPEPPATRENTAPPVPAPVPQPAPTVSSPRPAAAAADARPAAAEPTAASVSAPDPALTPVPIPETVPAMIEQLRARDGHVAQLIARGDFGAVWVPAFAARDIAIALEPHLSRIAPDRREATAAGLQQIVRLAWLLDAAGDAGNREQIAAVHREFSAAMMLVTAAFDVR